MKEQIYLRPLTVADARVSYLWRADTILWRYTHFKATRTATQAKETEWLQSKLLDQNDARFAICLTKDDEYIGNAQLIEIRDNRAELYIFIGDKSYWGNGIGTYATQLILHHGFSNLKLEGVFLYVNKANTAAVSIFRKFGFSTFSETDGFLEMNLDKQKFTV
ncbi:MAG: N-acetyltransferase [Chryseobacterium sp.]|nr:MAG: N-acetyltransferase [Chryseobacterium sp.]